MVHTAPPSPGRRRYESTLGVVAVLAGAILIAITVIALHHPKGRAAPLSDAAQSSPSKQTSARASTTPKVTAGSSASQTARSTPPATSSVTTTSRPSVVVLNNTSDSATTNLAVSRFRTKGWAAVDGGGFDGSILSTAVYYDPDSSGALAAAQELQREFPAIQRVKEKFTGLPSGPLVVVLTSDYS